MPNPILRKTRVSNFVEIWRQPLLHVLGGDSQPLLHVLVSGDSRWKLQISVSSGLERLAVEAPVVHLKSMKHGFSDRDNAKLEVHVQKLPNGSA